MKALIVDDEYMSGEYLRGLIREKCPEIKAIQCETAASDAIGKLQEGAFDLLFLDIEMPEMSGFELIEIVGAQKLPPIIFTTAYGEYALNAIKVSAVDYLLKPIDPEELLTAVGKVRQLPLADNVSKLGELMSMVGKEGSSRLAIANGSDYFLIDPHEIIHIEGSGSYSTFYMDGGRKIVSSRPLNYYYQRLSDMGFLRTHQSHVVNLRWIDRYSKSNGGIIFLKNNQNLPVSARLKKEVQKELGLS